MSKTNKNEDKENKTKTEIAKTLKTNEQRLPNHLQRLQPKLITRAVPQVSCYSFIKWLKHFYIMF